MIKSKNITDGLLALDTDGIIKDNVHLTHWDGIIKDNVRLTQCGPTHMPLGNGLIPLFLQYVLSQIKQFSLESCGNIKVLS